MYPLLISGALALSILLGFLLVPEKPAYVFGPLMGLLAFVPAFLVLTRRMGEKVRPLFEQAQRQAKAGNVPQAIETLEKALGWRRWQLFLGAQIHTEIGLLHYAQGNEKQAIEHLRRGYPKVSHGHLVLAAALYRDGKLEDACKALELGIRYNRRSPILYNVLAWLLAQEKQRERAIAVLARGLAADPADEGTKDNLVRLQNDKRMNMKPFGDLWYLLKFETMKGAQQQPFRKGFRQPPKQPKSKAR